MSHNLRILDNQLVTYKGLVDLPSVTFTFVMKQELECFAPSRLLSPSGDLGISLV